MVRVCFLIGATVAFLTTLWVISNLWDRAAATADPTATGCVRHPRYDHGRSLSPVGPVHSRSAHIGCFRRCVVPGWSSCRLAADAPQRRALTTARTPGSDGSPAPPASTHPTGSSPATRGGPPAAPALYTARPAGTHPTGSSPVAPGAALWIISGAGVRATVEPLAIGGGSHVDHPSSGATVENRHSRISSSPGDAPPPHSSRTWRFHPRDRLHRSRPPYKRTRKCCCH